jgi:hypothetical protein
MATQNGKPVGWFKYVLAMDAETTGLKFNSDDPSIGHQAVSWGFIVAEAATLQPVEKLYVEIKWNDTSLDAREADPKFGKHAEKIHGLTLSYLEENGMDEEDAVTEIGSLILKYWADGNIRCLGHNVATFDIWFLKRMMRAYDIELKFGARHIDTNGAGFINFETFTSDVLFQEVGFEARDDHNALDDAFMALESARIMRMIFKAGLDG